MRIGHDIVFQGRGYFLLLNNYDRLKFTPVTALQVIDGTINLSQTSLPSSYERQGKLKWETPDYTIH